MKVRYLGHSAFRIETGNEVILIDPFLAPNKDYNFKDDNISHILVTHAHSDHLGSAIEISKIKGATIVGVFELANYCAQRGAKAIGVNLGGWVKLSFGRVYFAPAFHSSSFADGTYAGCPAGILADIEGKRVFHAGDSALTQEYKTLKELNEIELAMLPIGGFYTMGVAEAIVATRWLEAKKVIPMHYNTFDLIKADVETFKEGVKKEGATPLVLTYNEEIEI
ncbi:metal-dependent hydrolase [bacterium]|nr:metal-dependent hydrolase [bacterium]